jgi:DNA-binding beta-propeller fold protein YncE
LRTLIYSLLAGLLLTLLCCRRDSGKINYGDYPPEIGYIMANSCAVSGCHNALSHKAAASYNLQTWKSMFEGSNSGSPVIPFSSRFSSLCGFINTYPELGIQNQPSMPFNRPALSREQVKTIRDWIDRGAPDVNGNVMWADNPRRKKLYAVNQGCDVVTVFDAATRLPMRYISVGNKPGEDTPHHIRVSPDGDYWYVTFINNNIMQKFRCSDDSYVGDIPLTPLAAGTGSEDILDWNLFVISGDGKRAYCTSLNANGRVSAVDLVNRRLLHYSAVLYQPHGIVLSGDETRLYVSSQYGNFMTELDSAFTGARTLVLENGASPSVNSLLDPHDMILSPDQENILITCQKTNEVRVFHLPSEKVTHSIPTGVFPQEIIYSEATNQYFVSCTEDYQTLPGATGILTRIQGSDYSATHIKCGYQPHGMAVDETRKVLYVLSRNVSTDGPLPHHTSECAGRNGFVNFIDLNTFRVLPGKYELSADPYYIVIRP